MRAREIHVAGLETGANDGQGLAFPRRAHDRLGQLSSDVPDVSRRFVSCSRQSAYRTQRTPHNLLDEFRWSRALRRRRCGVDLLAIACLMRLARCPLRPRWRLRLRGQTAQDGWAIL